MARLVAPALLAFSVLVSSLAEELVVDDLAAVDDECSTRGDTDCGLHALQRRVQKAEARIAKPSSHQAIHASPQVDNGTDASLGASAGACSARPYQGQMTGNELCFCQLVKNPKCAMASCACPQGCTGVSWEHPNSVSFKNKATAEGCSAGTVVLTSPRAYYKDPQDLKKSGCAKPIVEHLVTDSWATYQLQVGSGPVWQCFHNSHIATVKYLHLQTFCANGKFHGMPTDDLKIASCVKMTSANEAATVAAQLASALP